jgi:hypothetical protein
MSFHIGKSLSSFLNVSLNDYQPHLSSDLKSVSVLVIDFFQKVKFRILWMSEKMSENLRTLALRSKRFKRFLESCSFFSESLERFIRCELMKFWIWVSDESREEEVDESVDMLKGNELTQRFRRIKKYCTSLLLFEILFRRFSRKK